MINKNLGIFVTAVALLNSAAALAQEPIINVVCAYSASTQVLQVFKEDGTYKATTTTLETDRQIKDKNVEVTKDFVKITRRGLKKEDKNVLTLSRVTGQLNMSRWENKEGKLVRTKNTKMATCVKNEVKF